MVGGARRNADDLTAQRLTQRIILALGITDQNIILRGQRQKDDQLLCRKRFAAAGYAGNDGGLVEQICTVAQQQIAGDGVLTVINAARLHDLLHTERHQRRQRFRGEGAQNINFPHANGQCCVQAVHLLKAQRGHLAHPLCGRGEDIVGVSVQLLLAVRRMHQRHHAQKHSLVTGGEVVKKFLHLSPLLFHVVGDRAGEIVVLLLLA